MRNNLDHHAPPKFPAWGWGVAALLIITSWLPLALIVRSRTVKTERQPIHLFLDMDFQPRYGPQDAQDQSWDGFSGPARFPDGRIMRPPVPGTVRYDTPEAEVAGVDPDDDHFYRGYETDGNLKTVMAEVEVSGNKVREPKYYVGFPEGLVIDRGLLERGRERYNIYCAVCHGRDGYGNGPVYERIKMRQNLDPDAIAGFPEPRDLHLPQVLDMPSGKLYDRITRGVFAVDEKTGRKSYTMWPYAAQVTPHDRWAIVAYIRLMQRAQRFPVGELPEDLRSEVQSAPTMQHPATPREFAAATGEVITVPPAFTVRPGELEDPELIAQGKELFAGAKLCWTCHQTEPEKVPPQVVFNAPKFMGRFWGTEVEVHEGYGGPLVKVKMDEGYFIESLRDPMKRISKGALPGMLLQPFTEREIKALMAYVKSLSE